MGAGGLRFAGPDGRHMDGPDARHKERQALTQNVGPRHKELRAPIDRTPGPDTIIAGRGPPGPTKIPTENAGPTHRLPGPNKDKLGRGAPGADADPRTQGPGPDAERRAPMQRRNAGPRHKERRARYRAPGPNRKNAGRGPPGPVTKRPGPRYKIRRPPMIQNAGHRHNEGAPGPDAERRAPTQRAPGPDRKSAGLP